MMTMRLMLLLLVVTLLARLSGSCVTAARDLSPEERATQTMLQMTPEEKFGLMRGIDPPPDTPYYVGLIQGVDRLGIPDLRYNDGPQGVRVDAFPATSTAWPSGMTVGGSWDPATVFGWGYSMGKEFYDKGVHVALGPGVNVQRVPYCGRNFEYISGEDQHLGYVLAQPAISGIQSWVVANAKHWVHNSQEYDRTTVSENVDERTQVEHYFGAFRGAIEAEVGSFMCSYNKIDNEWSCENYNTLTTQLRGFLNYSSGFVMSDWGATHSVSVAQGLDQELPNAQFFTDDALYGVDMGLVNASVVRILTPFYKIGLFDKPNNNNITMNVTSAANVDLARRMCENSSVLLQNGPSAATGKRTHSKQSVLPIQIGDEQVHVVVPGLSGAWSPIVHGTGSGAVVPSWVKPPLWSICDKMGVPRLSPGDDQTSCNSDKSACVTYLNATAAPADSSGGFTHALLFIGQVSGEGYDRTDLGFPDGEDAVVAAWGQAGASNGYNTVVVMSAPGAMLTPWAQYVDGILNTWMAGQGMADCTANLLFGTPTVPAVSPSGKLHMTFPNVENEQQMTQDQYPGVNDEVSYSEGGFFGYRWYDQNGVQPAFPFGFGLSYASFQHGTSLDISPGAGSSVVTVTAKVSNAGPVAASEVVQMYIGYPPQCKEPPKLLRGFEKVHLGVGNAANVKFAISQQDISVWDVDLHAWVVCGGTFTVMVGSSSADIHATGTFKFQ